MAPALAVGRRCADCVWRPSPGRRGAATQGRRGAHPCVHSDLSGRGVFDAMGGSTPALLGAGDAVFNAGTLPKPGGASRICPRETGALLASERPGVLGGHRRAHGHHRTADRRSYLCSPVCKGRLRRPVWNAGGLPSVFLRSVGARTGRRIGLVEAHGQAG